MELLYALLAICLLVGLYYLVKLCMKVYSRYKKPKPVKEEKPKEEKKEPSKLVYGDAPRPIVLSEEESNLQKEPVLEDAESQEEQSSEELEKIDEQPEEELESVFGEPIDEDDDFDEYKHFPAISAMMGKDKKTIAEEINSLSPEVKAILLSNILDKKDL